MQNLYNLFSRLYIICLIICLSACGTTAVRDDGTRRAASEASSSVRDSFSEALSLMDAENYKEAIDILEKINQQNNRLAGVHANLGIAYGKLNQYDKAKLALEEAVSLNSTSADIMNEMAIAYRNSGDYESSRQTYNKILEKDPKNVQSHLNLGILCDIYINDTDCALKHYKEYEAIYAFVPDEKKKKQAPPPPKIKKNEKVVQWIADIEKRK